MEKYRNREAALEERLDDLMSRMTLEEKILQTDQFLHLISVTKRQREE